MQKIMFNDRYGLTEAVLEGSKTMTRRIIKCPKKATYIRVSTNKAGNLWSITMHDGTGRQIGVLTPFYKIGEIAAIAQSYKTIRDKYLDNKYFAKADTLEIETKYSNGWKNKMFTRADIMPRHIKITNIRVKRLQDISDEDCLREGIYPIKSEDVPQINETGVIYYTYSGIAGIWTTPRQAFAALIDKVGEKGTWASNPWVFCYSFELVD